MAYIDTVMGYLNPRMAFCMNLVGIDEDDLLGSNITIGPNPASISINLVWNREVKPLSVALFDLTGREIRTIIINNEETNLNIDTENLATGNYILSIRTLTAVARKKFVVAR